ncbi:MAG TPA: trypsin-like peptidase domain-containing protein [Acidimicrobiales bacterium]|nr:trypsin-like peptidase domain-containing protein [Acidimicrobiales bacterium]
MDEHDETTQEDATTAEVAATSSWESPMPLSMPPMPPAARAPEQPFVPADVTEQVALPADVTEQVAGAPSIEAPAPWYVGDASGAGSLPPGDGGPLRGAGASPERPGGRHRVVAVAAAAALLAGGVGAGLGVALGGSSTPTTAPSHVPVIASPGTSTQTATGPTESTAAIAKAVTPAIVDINTNVASPASQGQEQAAGTGMIITASGEVLTNNHVVANATKISIHVQGYAGSYGATVIGVDPTKDVALLQIEGFSGRLPTVSLGNSSTVPVGSAVVAIGNALGFGQQPTTVTGIVSALGRTITASDQSITTSSETLHNLIETDAPIQPGDSGGPLVNSHGQVIGMDTAASSASQAGSTLGFAIPINEARAIVQQMEKGHATGGIVLGENAFLGIFEGTSSFGFGGFGASTGATGVAGVAVSDVAIGGPAQAAGIAAGDTITAVGSTPTTSIAALQRAISSNKPGDQVTVTYVDTTGASHTATVTLAGLPK